MTDKERGEAVLVTLLGFTINNLITNHDASVDDLIEYVRQAHEVAKNAPVDDLIEYVRQAHEVAKNAPPRTALDLHRCIRCGSMLDNGKPIEASK